MNFLSEARRSFHAALMVEILKTDRKGVPSNADKHSPSSVEIARDILKRLGSEARGARLAGQMAGAQFEKVCAEFVRQTFLKLKHLRPGSWEILHDIRGGRLAISHFDQYEHLAALDELARQNPDLATALGRDYLIKPDVVILRHPEDDDSINAAAIMVGEDVSRLTSLRRVNNSHPILHASISCKWTLRSDRAQNARSEALNLSEIERENFHMSW